MPRGIPNKKRRGRRSAVEESEETEVEVPTLIPPSGAVPSLGGGLGGAIESVRSALEPFDDATRKKVIRAATVMLK